MRASSTIVAVLSSLLVCLGCLADDDWSELGRASQEIGAENALAFNRIALNRIALNRIALNRIALNRIALNRIALNRLHLDNARNRRKSGAGLHMDELIELLKYMVRCALNAGDAVVLEYNGIEYRLPGLLGVAPQWRDGPLPADRHEILSACLLAHANGLDVSVAISLRSAGIIPVDVGEAESYPVYEATFFGDLFEGNFLPYACTATGAELARSLSPDRELRVCSDGTERCLINHVGRCADVCDSYIDGYGWQQCSAYGRQFKHAVAVYLSVDAEGSSHRRCQSDQDCRLGCQRSSAVLTCSQSRTCQAECDDGASCAIDGYGSHNLRAVVAGRSRAEINCRATGQCSVECSEGSECEIDCTDSESCDRVVCGRATPCLLRCAAGGHNKASDMAGAGRDAECRFAYCEGRVKDCGDGTIVCNRQCPEQK
ncbi:MAG: hypothetical protein MJE77_30050 [Proteobacteria bacterium]|nr:hypothetical protein [Pseudomonadota bacterium]